MKQYRITLPAKNLRAEIIRDSMDRARIERAVCFTCGNAAQALRRLGIHVLQVGGPRADLMPARWWTPAEIRATWPGWYDATPGHLPMATMELLAARYRQHLGELGGGIYIVPTGSGETILAIHLAYPELELVAEYDDRHQATRWEPANPLNGIVARIARISRLPANPEMVSWEGSIETVPGAGGAHG